MTLVDLSDGLQASECAENAARRSCVWQCARVPPKMFRVTFIGPDHGRYETTGRASCETEAVLLADDFLEEVEGFGIRDFLESDGLSVRPPARLLVERVATEGAGLHVTHWSGAVSRTQEVR